jgi:hypothetical protein
LEKLGILSGQSAYLTPSEHRAVIDLSGASASEIIDTSTPASNDKVQQIMQPATGASASQNAGNLPPAAVKMEPLDNTGITRGQEIAGSAPTIFENHAIDSSATLVKTETIDAITASMVASPPVQRQSGNVPNLEDMDGEELQFELRKIELARQELRIQQRELEIQQRELEVQQHLKRLQRHRSGATSNEVIILD